jgi:hypothetical protein
MVVQKRHGPFGTYTLSPEALAVVAELAERDSISKSAVIERLLRREARREGLDVKELGKKQRQRRRSR